MARRKYNRNQRHDPATERSFPEYIFAPPAQQTSRDELMRLVRGGEDTFLELKVKLSNPEKITQGIIALANTGGGLIVFGVNDNMRVEGVDDAEEVREELVRICREEVVPALMPYIDLVSFDSGRRIVALDVEGKRRPYRTRDGRYFIRVGAEKREASREELSALLDEARPVRLENVAAIGARLEDIDEALLWSFVREFEGDAFEHALSSAGYPTADVLERDLLLAVHLGANGAGGEAQPTNAGLLLFGRDERVAELLPRSAITATRFAGDTAQSPKVESVQLRGNLHTLYESAVRFVERYCDLWDKRPRAFAGRREEEDADAQAAPVAARSNYHRASIQEAVTNALAHRDLALRDQTTRLNVYDHSIEITNPRRSAGFAPAMQRAIRYGVPARVNPQTAALLTSRAYGLNSAGGGLPALLRDSRLFSGRKPEIHTFNDEFRLRIYGA
ncbi:MAG TPA: RNA-binding domain-containing protein [Pyrinomonadaceae bacterium]|nr:RNA-binding domain-containing protein [Pyrinomonadaceae bacterium]